VQWSEAVSGGGGEVTSPGGTKTVDVSTMMLDGDAPAEIKEAWQECEQLRKAVLKNNGMKRNIAKRLKLNEKEAEKFREELGTKITGEDRKELMELQYQVT
jgi:hypothetical protein